MANPKPWLVAQDDGAVRKHAQATLRNREPIAQALATILAAGTVLEASGSGEQCTFFAERFGMPWQPSDSDPAAPRLDRCMVRGNGKRAAPDQHRHGGGALADRARRRDAVR